MRILVTGINGFIGQHIQEYFHKKKYELIGVEQQNKLLSTTVRILNWQDLNNIKEVDCIIHLAGLAHDTNNKRREEEYYHVNTKLTKTIFNFFLSSSAKTFIFFSTVKAVSDFSNIPLIETVIPAPTSLYGKSKLSAEKFILDNLPEDGRNVYILRPCMIHGPKAKGNLISLYSYIRRGMPYPFGNLSNSRSYLSINNLTFIIEKLINSTIESGIYHLADDEALSTKQIINLIAKTLNKKPLILNIPTWIINTIAWFGTILHLPINQSTIIKLTSNFFVSNEKIKKALNIELPLRAEAGMLYTLRNIK